MFGLRGSLGPGNAPRFARPGLDPAAVAGAGEGVLAACHTSDNRTVGTFHLFGRDLSPGQPLPVDEGGDKTGTGPNMVQDLAVSGDRAWTLDVANKSMNPAFCCRLTVFALLE